MEIKKDIDVMPRMAPPIEPFSPTAPPGSLAFDLEQVAKRKARENYYKDSKGSYKDLPQVIEKKPALATPSRYSVTPQGKDESFLDFVYRLIWGSTNETNVTTDDNSTSSPISGTPELEAYKRQVWKVTQEDLELILIALREAHRSLEGMHDAVKQDYAEGTRIEDSRALLIFLFILKQQMKLKNGEQLTNAQAIQSLHKATKKIYEEKGDHYAALEKALSQVNTANSIGGVASVFVTITAVLKLLKYTNLFKHLGFDSLSPGVEVAVELFTLAVGGIKGGTELAKVHYEREADRFRGEMERAQHYSDKHSHLVKDYNHSNSLVGHGLTQAMRTSMQTLERARKLAKEANNFK